jgi:hypothetical protein
MGWQQYTERELIFHSRGTAQKRAAPQFNVDAIEKVNFKKSES